MTRPAMAVIGVGALGRHHARILSELPCVELRAVVDPNPETARRVAASVGADFFHSHHEILDDVDAAAIAAPTVLHLDIARDFIRRRIPVLVEKPLASTLSDAQQLVELAVKHQCLLQVGHVERFNPATKAAESLVQSPRYIRAERVSPFSLRSTDIGAIHDLMIHDIDLSLSFAQAEVTSVHAFGVSLFGGYEDTVQARLTFDNGCIADLIASRACSVAKRFMQIWSPETCVTIDFAERDVTSFTPTESLRFGRPLAERARDRGADIDQLKRDVFEKLIRIEHHSVAKQDALTAELGEFVDAVTGSRVPTVDGSTALKAMQVAERILESVANHRWDGHASGRIGPKLESRSTMRQAG